MYSYRSGVVSTRKAIDRFCHIEKLGQILSVRGYRFQSTRHGAGENTYVATHERVMIEGRNGKARFDGVLWGYGGDGPRALVELLIKTGLHRLVAEYVAFKTPRLNDFGNDFHLEYNHNGSVIYTTPQTTSVLHTEVVLKVKQPDSFVGSPQLTEIARTALLNVYRRPA